MFYDFLSKKKECKKPKIKKFEIFKEQPNLDDRNRRKCRKNRN